MRSASDVLGIVDQPGDVRNFTHEVEERFIAHQPVQPFVRRADRGKPRYDGFPPDLAELIQRVARIEKRKPGDERLNRLRPEELIENNMAEGACRRESPREFRYAGSNFRVKQVHKVYDKSAGT